MQPRRLAVLLALVLACLPPALAQTGAKQPQIGYSPSDTHADVEQGTAVTYTFTLTLQPADGQDTVNLYPHFTRYGSGDLAPATTVAFRLLSSGGGYTPLGSFSGFGENTIRHSMVGGQYSIQATSTVQLNDPLGSHASYLTLTAIPPGATTSTQSIAYPFSFNVLPANLPHAEFESEISGLTVAFNSGKSTGQDLTFLWAFGDGTSSTQANVTHQFSPGNYLVSLTVSDRHGRTDHASSSLALGTGGGSGGGGGGGGGGGTTGPLDSDGDGFSDSAEATAGSDAHNAASRPDDRDGDGKANGSDNCPAAANADQKDTDHDSIGDACDPVNDSPSDDQDHDGAKNSADNCPTLANADQKDGDGDGVGDVCDLNLLDGPLGDLDHDGFTNRAETTAGTDPRDRDSPPWRATHAFAVPANRAAAPGVFVGWTVPLHAHIKAYLLWREAPAATTLVGSFPSGETSYRYDDRQAPDEVLHYLVQPQFDAVDTLLLDPANGTRTNAVTLHSVVMDCPDLCAALKQRWGLDPNAADSDGDGRSDGDEVTGAHGFFSLPILADSNGNGLADGGEVARGLDPLDNHPAPPPVPTAKRSPPAAAILVAAGLLALAWRRR